ncbi:MAG: diacylglycerol kinase, partial [Pseudomonadota bacterium]
WRRFKGRCVYSTQGLILAWREEHSFRFWAAMNGVSASLALVLPLSATLTALIVALGLLILAAECMNTAIERVVNHVSPGPHPLAKAAKDAGSASVAITAVAAGVAWVGGIWSLF